jgi:hypothetical protein
MIQPPINQKNMSTETIWETLAYWSLWATAGVAVIGFPVALGTIYIGYRSGLEKDAKARAQEERTALINTELEQTKNKGRELELSLARREIPFVTSGDGTTNIDTLRRFGGFNVVIEYLPEVEPRRAARSLHETLKLAGWNIVSVAANTELESPFFDGVKCDPYNALFRPDKPVLSDRSKSVEACNTLVTFLKEKNWEATTFAGIPGELPPDTVRVRIGFKPLPHVLTTEEEEFFDGAPEIDPRLKNKKK